jgi:hypothetical protein
LTPATRARVARWACLVSVVAWPVTQVTLARSEPPFVLGLSWLALIISLLDVAATTDVRDKSEEARDAAKGEETPDAD